MKNKKIIIDIAMLVLLILLYNLSITGVLVHEIIGIAIWILFIIHLGINYNWIKNMTKNILKNKLKKQVLKLYLVDLLIFIDYLVVTISGILISKYIFNFNFNLAGLHKISSLVGIVLIMIHLIMHTKFFANKFSKMLNDETNKKGMFLTVVMIIASFFLFTNEVLLSKIKSKISEESYSEDENVLVDVSDDVNITDYLSNLFCTGCPKRCPLSNPKCSVGEKQASEAIQDYNEMYS